jgi:hypothetical protein
MHPLLGAACQPCVWLFLKNSPMSADTIKGGYYMKARKIQESEIAHAPPHVREIWDFFLCTASHSNGKSLERGQLLTSYEDIREALHWMVGWRKMRYSKWDCEKALKWLKKATMITTQKTTKGMIVTICNYRLYQNPKNYESHTEAKGKATRKPQTTDTIDKNVKNVKNNNKKLYSENSVEFHLSRLLLNKILEREPNYKKPNLQKWAKQIDLMVRRDNRKPEIINKIILWCQQDEFWQNNILSTTKLRKQFDQLKMMKGQKESFADRVARVSKK